MTFTKELAVAVIGGLIVAALTPLIFAAYSQITTGNPFQWLFEVDWNGVIIVGISVLVAALIVAFVVLHIRYDMRKPALVVAKSPKEDYFKERIIVHNRNDTVYHYRIRVNKTYLKWQSEIARASDPTYSTLYRDSGSGVILDDVVYQLEDHPIIIEAIN